MPRVSVIIPSHNCEAFIAQTIDSVLQQTFDDIELLVVDDGSTDRTVGIVQGYDPPVRLIRQANAGVCVARNRGIREAVGEFICLLDHDDVWFPHKLERQLRAFADNPEAGVVFSSFILWQHDDRGRFPAPSQFVPGDFPDRLDPDYSGWIYHQFLLDCWMLTSTAMFRAEVFERCGVFDESLPFSEDWDLWLRISRCYPMVKLVRPTTLYRQHAEQGNRVVRDIDYRTRLLRGARKAWGLCSPDGRCVTARQFRRQLAEYDAAFGLFHLRWGRRPVGVRALARAWLTDPLGWKYPAYMLAGAVGWRPSW